MPTLESIHIYPIKATRAVDLEVAEVQPRGLAHDRRWMLVDSNGQFLTQRDHPRLALVETRVTQDGLMLEAEGMQTLRVPFPSSKSAPASVRVWQDTVSAVAADAAAHDWFARFLDIDCSLVYMPDTSRRRVDPDYAVGDDVVSFADGYPLLLASEASLAALNSRLAVSVPMTRFRPNVVISGADAFAEDDWKTVQIGDVRFHAVKPCARCVVTTIDQETADVGKEPLRTLSAFRRVGSKVLFGMNLIPASGGSVRVGDSVVVTEQ